MAEEVAGFTQAQKKWLLERDGHRCQMRFHVNGGWVQCHNTERLQCHHILPRGHIIRHEPKDYPTNSPNNGIVLCATCHCGYQADEEFLDLYAIHPDTELARLASRYDKGAYANMMAERRAINSHGLPYWNTRHDWLLRQIAEHNTRNFIFEKDYPADGKRGITGRIKEVLSGRGTRDDQIRP